MRALLLHHPYTYPRFEQDFVDRVAELDEFDVVAADVQALEAGTLAGGDRSIALSHYDAVIVFVAFRRLRTAPTLDWGDFLGLRVLMDHDIIQNYSDIFDATLGGAWPPVFHRHRFDTMVTSGLTIRSRLAGDGIAADWVPKGFEPARFPLHTGRRSGIATYGSAYACRQVAERALRDARIPLKRLDTTPYLQLGAKLNRFLGCLAISSDLEVPPEQRATLARAVARDVPMRPGLEPMAKLFEAAGAGCCPIADAMDDLEALGFRDGETCLTFRSHAELVEKVRGAVADPRSLAAMGAAAAALARAEHTWSHRARTLRDVIARRLQHSSL
ncbi:MAG: glycosyltransferase family 1 protein [Gemmatimonadaceae bacterium]|nr:glycosyltransferase family 1 protein [Gemmatimonadaceae bacterium]